MALSDVKIHSPRNVAEALRLLRDLEDSYIMAGGTDLLVEIKKELIQPKNVVSLQRIEELYGIKEEGDKIRIGAMVTPQEIISNPLINEHFPAISDAARSMGSNQIRSMATVGGNIASAVPSADFPPILIASDASILLRCIESLREVPLLEFFTGPRITVCREEEILMTIHIPYPKLHTGMSFQKFSLREANALAVASVASRLSLKKEKIESAAIVLGAVAPTPVFAQKASDFLLRRNPSEEHFEKAAQLAKEEGKPISDIRGSVWFRKELILTLTRRSLTEALERCQEKRGKV